MENAEEILHALEEFSKLKPKDIPKELDDYLGYVAKSGDPVYQWQLVKYLFHEKLSSVITEFYQTSTVDLPPCPNVDPFNYERMKTSLLERLDTFPSAPFTIQRICELLTSPKKQYNRVDKFMRAIEKNILVVSTREPGIGKSIENDQTETVLNGIPDGKYIDTEDRIVTVCSDNIQFSNTIDSVPIPVENAINSCVIQEEIEIGHSNSTNTVITTETKVWCDDDKGHDLEIKHDLIVVKSDIDTVSTSTTPLLDTELPKNSNIMFVESEIKDDTLDVSSENVICTETVVSLESMTPDSPDPINSEDDDSLPQIEKSEDSCDAPIKEDEELLESYETCDVEIGGIVEHEEIVANTQDKENTPLIDTTDDVDSPQESTEKDDLDNEETVNDVKDEVSSDINQSDSINEVYECVESSSCNLEVLNEEEVESEIDETEKCESSTPDENILIEDVTSSEISEEVCNDEISSEELTSKDSEVSSFELEECVQSEDIKSSLIEEVTATTSDEIVASSSDCVVIEEITTSEKDDVVSATSEVVIENVESSTDSEEIERKEGSIIHVTSSVSDVEAEVSQTNRTIDEDITTDQTTSVTEDEAMDVDESSNQPMVTSEGENETEPMDQSDQQLAS